MLWTAFSIVVILLAAGVGVGKLLMPYSQHYQPELEAWLSKEFGQPVAIDSFEGDWTAFGPRLTLRGMKLLPPSAVPGDEVAEVVIESAALDIKPLNYLLVGKPLYNFRVIGARFELLRDAEGEFQLSGFGVSNRTPGRGRSALSELARVGEVVLQDSSLDFVDEVFGIRLGLGSINGRLILEGSVLAAEVRARLFDRRAALAYGNLDGTVVLTLDAEQRLQGARWQGKAERLMMASFQGKLPASPFIPLTGWLDAELWGEWERGGGHRINGMTRLSDALLANEFQDIHVTQVQTRFRWRFSGGGLWNLHLADFLFEQDGATWSTPRLSVARDVPADVGLWISADRLPLGVPLNLTRDIMTLYGTDLPSGLPAAADGLASGVDVVLSADWRLRLARGRVAGASVSNWYKGLSLDGLDATADLGDGYGTVRVSSGLARLDWPYMFRDPLAVELLPCSVDVSWGGGWLAGFEGCTVQNDDAAASGDLWLRGDEHKPIVDANFRVLRGQAGQLGSYWPESNIPDNVKAWLRRALLDGELTFGRYLMKGDMDNFPFRDGAGRFEAVADVEDLALAYHEDWPAVRRARATVHFDGPGMVAQGSVADSAGAVVDSVRVRIADMKTPLLEVDYETRSELPALLGFLQQSPLQREVDVDLDEFEFSGPAAVTGSVRVPLGRTPGEDSVQGTVVLDGAGFAAPAHDVRIEAISGELRYDQRGFTGSGLAARSRGQPARLDLLADADREETFRAELSGNFDVDDLLLGGRIKESLRLLEQVRGRSRWVVSLAVGPGEDPERNQTTLGVRSELRGVAMDLPAPFGKAAIESWPFRLAYPLSGDSRVLDIVFEERAALRFELPQQDQPPLRGLVSLGGQLAPLPDTGLLRLEGRTPLMDLDGWVSAVIDEMSAGSAMGGLVLEPGDLHAGKLLFLDRRFDDVGIDFGSSASEFRIGFDSRDLDGTLRFTLGGAGLNSLTAEFDRLKLGEPVSTGVTMETDPKDLPALHLYAGSLSYAGIELGETRIEAYPTAEGFHFEKVDAVSDGMSVQASGDWSRTGDGHRSDFRINMASESLGDFLHSMDISSSVQGGQTLVNVNAWWDGTPGAFALSRLNGQVDFNVVDGSILNADAGPGRLLGLVSFTALPKRLALDFRDVFEEGFSFDEAGGSFSMENGVAQTDDVELSSSSASIIVSGQTDLVNRRYDQLMTIRPGVGNTLPIIGALTGGPGGAAAGLALQGLLHDSLGEATQVRYTITGSWDEPVIEPVEVRRAGGNE